MSETYIVTIVGIISLSLVSIVAIVYGRRVRSFLGKGKIEIDVDEES